MTKTLTQEVFKDALLAWVAETCDIKFTIIDE